MATARSQNSFLGLAQVIDLSKQQELTKAQELKTEEAKAQAAAQQYSIVRPHGNLLEPRGWCRAQLMSFHPRLQCAAVPSVKDTDTELKHVKQLCCVLWLQERERVHWEEQRKAMQADMGNKAELARCANSLLQAGAPGVLGTTRKRCGSFLSLQRPCISQTWCCCPKSCRQHTREQSLGARRVQQDGSSCTPAALTEGECAAVLRRAPRWACRYNDDLARKRADGEHEEQRTRQRELVAQAEGYAQLCQAEKPRARRYNDDLARKRADGEHEKQRARQRELVGLQEESARRQEAERRRVAEQIEAERRATEKYKARSELGGSGLLAP